MTIKQEILNELLKEYSNPEDLMGKGGIFDELQKRLLETVMKAEMGNHLGYEKIPLPEIIQGILETVKVKEQLRQNLQS